MKTLTKILLKLTGIWKYLKPIYLDGQDCYRKAKKKAEVFKSDGKITKEERKQLAKLIIEESDEIALGIANLIIYKIIK